ncbi:hypothetical protein HMPREF9622_00821 [Cutibacterium modestum HL037PA3]|nr:hypothetical protein HMPREF9621_00434 [Cutibacterium modestum HL037PA2]EFT15964.1 hypothetical protein HMPREF9622_00821 [Cutibacterium modestum HL037PA3]
MEPALSIHTNSLRPVEGRLGLVQRQDCSTAHVTKNRYEPREHVEMG